jgi:small subunit ribosomal protein S16
MVKIRLMRVGKRKQPSYRVVVADSRSARDGRIIEAIGHYQPRSDPSEISVDNARAVHWLEHGAQPSSAVKKILEISGAWSEFSGEAPAPRTPTRKATPAASVTTASERSDSAGSEETSDGEDAGAPEAEEQAAAAPDADTDSSETPSEGS